MSKGDESLPKVIKEIQLIGWLILLSGCASTTTVSEKNIHLHSTRDTLSSSERDTLVNSARNENWVNDWIGEYEGVGAAMFTPLIEDPQFIGYQKGWNEGLSVRLSISYAGAQSVNISGGADSSLTKDDKRKFFKDFGVGFIPLKDIHINSAETLSGESQFVFGSTYLRVEYNFTRRQGMLSGYVKQYRQLKTIPDQAVRFDILRRVDKNR